MKLCRPGSMGITRNWEGVERLDGAIGGAARESRDQSRNLI